MMYKDLDTDEFELRQEYEAHCSECDNSLKVRAQADDTPEYNTRITAECSCGGTIHFTLPVN